MNRLFAALALLLAPAGAAFAGQPIDDTALRLPHGGDYGLHILSPSLLELTLISEVPAHSLPPSPPTALHASDFTVQVDGTPLAVKGIGFKRRVLYAPLVLRDLRASTDVYLELERPIQSSGQPANVTVKLAGTTLVPSGLTASTRMDPLRYSPAIHVNQEGYVPNLPKIAMVGYYIGTLGELDVPAQAGFDVVDGNGKSVLHGDLMLRRDVGFAYAPKPYQQVYQADFTGLHEPGVYRLVVPGLGASLPFRIGDGELMTFARAYELGLYHQRCGMADELPYTRFTHDACHTAPAEVPMPADRFDKAWEIIRNLEKDRAKADRPVNQLKTPEDQLYPFTRAGAIDVAGGHHDAGDYSKYTINSATLIHNLMFAVDSFPGVADLDNLGIPESGDHISDIMEEAKWESDFLAKMQDEDGGFYFLVYPRDRRYEGDVLPDHGDHQIVWPKNTAATAAATAALAQCASSPKFSHQYPDDAKRYLAAAERGWQFLEKAVAAHGRAGAYQRLTHYGDMFDDTDELAWAACELFLATGDAKYHDALRKLYPNPADQGTMLWTWGRAAYAYGNALRSYAFAARSGRLAKDKLDPLYLGKCETELIRAGDDAVRWSDQNAYGMSYPEPSKRQVTAGWYFSMDAAFDLTTAYQLDPQPKYERAVLANLNAVAGTNAVNVCFITGLGQHRQREIVHQYARNDARVLPPTGIPIGDLHSSFDYLGLYGNELRQLSYPADDGRPPYPLYDRWSDAYNVATEFTVVSQTRELASVAFWAAQTPLKTQPWKAAAATITAPRGTVGLNVPVTFTLQCKDLDLSDARVVWEGRDQEPAYGPRFTMIPRTAGPQWVEAEAALPDGRRVFAHADFEANAPVVIWVDGALPKGASGFANGGDNWGWIKPASKPPELAAHAGVPQHESGLAHGVHEHGFNDALDTLTVGRGDILFAYIFIDPRNVPETIMLEWNDGSNEHRAFWGQNKIPWGKMNTASQWPMGPLPPAGRWVRLEVPASVVGLEGHTIKGMVFRLYDGRARWDAVGKMSATVKELGSFHPPPPRSS